MNKLRAISLSFLAIFVVGHITAQVFATGLNFDDAAYAKTPLKKSEIKRSYDVLPAKVDLKPYCPTPQQQGEYSTCVGWSIGYAACTISEGVAKHIKDKTALNNMASSPEFVYAVGKSQQDAACNKGTLADETLVKLKGIRIPRKKDFRVFCSPSNALPFTKGDGVVISDFVKLFDNADPFETRLKQIKKALANNNSVVIGIKCFKSFKEAKEVWSGQQDVYMNGHAVCIVGYDDSFQGGAVDIMNSWGEAWGNNGFTKIKYADLASILKYAHEIKTDFSTLQNSPTQIPENNPIPSSKGLPTVDFTTAISLKLADGAEMTVQKVQTEDRRGLKPVKATEMATAEPEKKQASSQYKTVKGYASGTKYRVYITLSEPVYLYVLGSDLTTHITPLFPPDASISPYISNKNATIALPDEKWFIEMDDVKGKDFMLLLYSKKALEIDKLVKQWNSQTGTAAEKIQKTMGSKLLPHTTLNLSANTMGFKTPLSIDSLILITLEIEHQ